MEPVHKQKNGISLRTVYLWMVIAALIMTCLMVYFTFHMTRSFREMTQATEEHIDLERAASDMMDASDYLTERVQRFAGTGNMQYLEEYFIESEETTRREKALEKMADSPGHEEAYEFLRKAMDASLELMEQEYYAMKLVVEAKGYLYYPEILKKTELSEEDAALSPDEKMQRATQLVINDDYFDLKNEIRSNMKQSLKEIETQTQEAEKASMDGLRSEMNAVRVVILLQALGFILVIWLTSKLGINPVLKAVDRIREDDPLPEIGASEFRYLAQAYNKMYDVYKKSLESLNFKASHDELTGAYNRTGYDLLISSIDWRTTWLMLFDVDQFKEINDTYGHQTGDEVLNRFVYVLKKNFRSDDYVCRFGGDEFCVFMVHADEKWRELVTSKIEKIRSELRMPRNGLPAFTVSCGIVHGSQAEDTASLVRMADDALYRTKKNGRDGYTFA